MRPLSVTRAIGLLAAGAMLIAACGGNAATTAPTTAPTVAPVATDAPGASPGFSFDLSSFHGDKELEGMIPDTIGGQKLTAVSMTGDQFLGDGTSSPELAAALQVLGKATTDLSVAFAGTSTMSVVAFRVKGVPADTLFAAFKEAETDDMTTENVTYGGKSGVKLLSPDGSTAVVYLKDDTMFLIGGSGSGSAVPTDEVLNEAFQKLP
jgi:hypothetical protein